MIDTMTRMTQPKAFDSTSSPIMAKTVKPITQQDKYPKQDLIA
jgi:hypothetical protein